MDPAYKSLELEAADLSFKEDGHGFTGYAARFGTKDQGGDLIVPGAFTKTLKSRTRRPLLWQHDTRKPIGVERSLKQDGNGLFGHWDLLTNTEPGKYAYEALKSGAISGMSIGYVPSDVEFAGDTRKLLVVDLLENSIVTLPMHEDAQVQSVKAQWDAAYVNDLPDSAFALILPGGSKDADGKTTPRDLRKLPHHDASGSLDMPHLRNAMSRCPQMEGVSDTERSHAEAHLKKHMDAAGGKALDDLDLDAPFGDMLAQVTEALDHAIAEAKALHARRDAEHRTLSETHREKLGGLLAQAEAALGLRGLLAPDQAGADAGDWTTRLELARRRLARMAA